MKNLFRIVMAVAVLFTASCAKEDISSSIGGGEVEVTFTADLGQLGTRAYGEADNVDVVYLGVYEANSNASLPLVDPEGYPVIDGKASITVVLLKDKVYDLVFWAQNKAQTCYNVVWDERKVAVNYDGVKSQDDARDAFFLVENDFRAGHDETIFKLYRPFAQLNAGLNAKDVEFIGKNGVEISKFKSQVVVKQVATTLNLLEEATDTALDVADFKDVTFALEAKPTQKLNVSGTDYEYLSMNYLLVDAKQNVDLTYTFVDGEGTEYLRPYFSVPVQRNYRTNILGQLISSPLDFNVIIVPDFIDPDNDLQGDTQTFNVSSQAEFEDALAKAATQDHIQHLVINLNADVTLDVDAWQTLAIGNKNTKDITINGSKSRAAEYYTLTFNHKNSDWNNIVTNGAKLILESLNITNSGYGATDAPWNRHDLVFACDVEMNNVVSLNAIALKANAKIENTTINDDHTGSSYAIWIQPNGQIVTIDNCTIDSTGAGDGRGIKIDEQYVDAPKKVVLNVSNTKFVTESKAAIVVKSKAGAEVNASNLDIAGVAADTVYAVWVDEKAAAYYNLVEVTGAQVRLEGSAIVTTQEELNAAVAAGKAQINLAAGNYNLPDGVKGAIIGTDRENCVVNIVKSYYGSTANTDVLTLQNLTTKLAAGFGYTEGTFGFLHHYKEVNLINCNSDRIRLNCSTANIEGCTFTLTTSSGFDGYAIYYYGNANSTVNVKDCVFYTAGKAIVIYSESAKAYNLNVDDCQFYSSDASTDKAAVQMHTEYGITGVVKINNCTATDFNAINNGLWNELNNNTKALTNVFEKYVDGVQVYNDVVVNNDKSVYTIYSATGLKWFANEVNVNKNSFSGKTVKLAKDIDLQNEIWTPIGQTGVATFNGVFDGQDYTISNLNVDSSAQTGKHYSSGLFGWVESHTAGHGHLKNVKISGANVTGHHNCGALVGYITQETALVENCHVTGATISCTYANGDADGDKAGALIGNATVATPVKDCTAANSTVSAGRDGGQVIGAGREANVTGCSATYVTVTANGTGTGENINNAVIGRLL